MRQQPNHCNMRQQPNQSVADFIAELWGVADRYDFSDTERKKALRDRFIVGITDAGLRKALMSHWG